MFPCIQASASGCSPSRHTWGAPLVRSRAANRAFGGAWRPLASVKRQHRSSTLRAVCGSPPVPWRLPARAGQSLGHSAWFVWPGVLAALQPDSRHDLWVFSRCQAPETLNRHPPPTQDPAACYVRPPPRVICDLEGAVRPCGRENVPILRGRSRHSAACCCNVSTRSLRARTPLRGTNTLPQFGFAGFSPVHARPRGVLLVFESKSSCVPAPLTAVHAGALPPSRHCRCQDRACHCTHVKLRPSADTAKTSTSPRSFGRIVL